MSVDEEFNHYIAHLSEGLGHADRQAGLSGYCTGLMLPLSRKSVEPMAARVDPLHASARHQALHHFVAKSEWSDSTVMARVRDWVIPGLGLDSGRDWVIDDTGFPKNGKHSVGVARRYCGQLGKQDNCHVAVSLSLASAQGTSAGIQARGCSRRLQRSITDLEVDLPYVQAMGKLVEHYGIVIAESTMRRVTLRHAKEIQRRSRGLPQGLPKPVAPQQTFITEMDGTMVPAVRSDPSQRDQRKGKSVQWQEAKAKVKAQGLGSLLNKLQANLEPTHTQRMKTLRCAAACAT